MHTAIFTQFIAYLLTEKRVTANTLSAYKTDIGQFLDFINNKNIELPAATLETLKDFLAQLKSLNMTARTMGRKISALKTFFEYLSEHKQLENRARDLIFPKIERRLPVYLSESEVHELFGTAERDQSSQKLRNKVMLYLLYVTGARISELVSLTRSQVQFDTGFIMLHGKGGKDRMVPIPAPMVTIIKDYIEVTTQTIIKRNPQAQDYLFPTVYAGTVKPITRQAFWGILKRLWSQTPGNNRSISPHTLRHSLATHMLKNGANLRSLQMLLGHEQLSTVQVYTHVEKSFVRGVYDKKHPRS